MPQPTLFGTEILVNAGETAGNQLTPSLAASPTGHFFVSWLNATSAQRKAFDAAGVAQSATSQSFSFTSAADDGLSTAVLSTGALAAVYTNPTATKADEIILAVTGGGFSFVNETDAGDQIDPQIVLLDNNRVVVVWTDEGSSTREVRGVVLDSDFDTVVDEFVIPTNTAASQVQPSVAALPGGQFVVTWTDGSGTLGDSSVNAIKGKIFEATGAPGDAIEVVKNEFLVNDAVLNAQTASSVAALAGGGFVIVWQHDADAGAGGNFDIRARLFDEDGDPVSTEDVVIDATAGAAETAPVVAGLPDGRYVVAWVDEGSAGETDGSGSHIRAAILTTNPLASPEEFVVNTTATNDQGAPTITVLADGRFVIAWTDLSNGANTDIRAQIFDSRLAAVNVTGTDLPDHYIGTAFNDTLGGGLGADLLLGEAGADSLSGGDGDETLKPGAGDDTVNGGANSDTVDYSAATGAINVDLRLTTAQTIGGGMGIDTLSNLENIIGSALGDTLNGNESANRIEAGNGGDTVFGHGNNDVILGGTGPDTIDGGAGDDTVAGGIGNDVLAGGAGVDTVDYSGLNGAVTLNLSTATAQNTGLGTDTLSGFENAVGGIGNDKFTGTTAANRIQGAAGSDQINGLGGADLLEGGEGNDNLQGGNGSDTLVGGAGRDIMVGGNDADVFRFLAFADSAVGGQRDRVNDFVQGEDSVDLEAIDAIPFFGGDDDFAFIGDADFSNEAAQLRYFQLSGSNQTILEGDLNADGNADFQVAFVGLIDFAASDFLGVT